MTFFRFIEKLQNKSEQKRRVLSFSAASVIFVLIFVVWVTTFQLNLHQVGNDERHDELSPLASLKKTSARFVKDIKGRLGLFDSSATDDFSVSSSDMNATANISIPHEFLDENIVGTTTENKKIFFGNTKGEILYATSSDDQIQQHGVGSSTETGNIDKNTEDITTDDELDIEISSETTD